jgi:hypothetical protein
MFRASLAPATLHFLNGNKTGRREIGVDGRFVTNAVDWDQLDAWAGERRVNLNEIDLDTLA